MSPRDRSTSRPPSRRRTFAWLALVLLLVVIALGVLAIPLAGTKGDAEAARSELRQAMDALQRQDFAAARTHVQSARAHVDAARSTLDGLPGTVWHWVPVAGGAVGDARHLVHALDDVTTVAEKTLDIYPQVLGQRSFADGDTIHLRKLEPIVAQVSSMAPYVDGAVAELQDVKGGTPYVGSWISDARDAALAQAEPVQASYDRTAPALEALPRILGGEGRRRYLLTFLNPAELRYSGGASLSFATMTVDQGAATFGNAKTVDELQAAKPFLNWRKVAGNPFHFKGKRRLTSATFTPYWSVGGEELLRAWHQQTGQRCDGLIALDLQGLAQLFGVTGPIDVPGYGTLDQSNLVRTLAGSYDRFENDDRRHALNEALIPIFKEKLLQGGRFLQKGKAITAAARGRHFFLYFRDHDDEQAFAQLGMDGDLSPTPHDYLGVFTQNINQSKADFWQKRTVSSDVTLQESGQAHVQLSVTEANPAPPYTQSTPDPKVGYFTRWLQSAVSVFLPRGASPGATTVDGRPERFTGSRVHSHGVYHRKFRALTLTLAPGASSTLRTSYDVPSAAYADGDALVYDLSLDPQGTVVPQQTHVVVHPPSGWHAVELPDGWQHTADGGAQLDVAATQVSQWQVRFVRTS